MTRPAWIPKVGDVARVRPYPQSSAGWKGAYADRIGVVVTVEGIDWCKLRFFDDPTDECGFNTRALEKVSD